MGKKTDDIDSNILLASSIEEETDFIPLIADEDEAALDKSNVPDLLPILPLRNTVLFPGVVIPITVGRDKSITLIKEIYKKIKIIGTVAQKGGTARGRIRQLGRVGAVGPAAKQCLQEQWQAASHPRQTADFPQHPQPGRQHFPLGVAARSDRQGIPNPSCHANIPRQPGQCGGSAQRPRVCEMASGEHGQPASRHVLQPYQEGHS